SCQRRPFTPGCGVFLPEVANGDDAGRYGQVITVAQLQGAVRLGVGAGKRLRCVENRLPVAGEEIVITRRYSPFAQCVIYHCAMGLPDECVEPTKHLLINGTFGKYVAYLIAEIIGISFRVKAEEL